MGGRGETAQCPRCRKWVSRVGMRDHMKSSHDMAHVVFEGGHLPSYPSNGVEGYRDLRTGVRVGATKWLTPDEIASGAGAGYDKA